MIDGGTNGRHPLRPYGGGDLVAREGARPSSPSENGALNRYRADGSPGRVRTCVHAFRGRWPATGPRVNRLLAPQPVIPQRLPGFAFKWRRGDRREASAEAQVFIRLAPAPVRDLMRGKLRAHGGHRQLVGDADQNDVGYAFDTVMRRE